MQRYLCPFDETAMREVENPFTVTVKGVDIAVRGIMQCVCPNCGSELVPIEMVRQNTQRVADAKRAHLGLLSGADITRIRSKILGLSRQRASINFGLGRNAFQKYEAEGQLQSQPTDKLLRVLEHSPSAMSALGGETQAPMAVEKSTTTVSQSSTATGFDNHGSGGSVTYIRDYLKRGAG